MPRRDPATRTVQIRGEQRTLGRFGRLTTSQRGQLLEMFELYAAGDDAAIQHLVDRKDPNHPGVAVASSTARILRIMAGD